MPEDPQSVTNPLLIIEDGKPDFDVRLLTDFADNLQDPFSLEMGSHADHALLGLRPPRLGRPVFTSSLSSPP